ncbi:MAG: hypothetical protein M2R46_00982 [Verrucomicrobia subdivision 3 bacterium]|nr:hypothetical protein [Limisphaerales bacterium]
MNTNSITRSKARFAGFLASLPAFGKAIALGTVAFIAQAFFTETMNAAEL